jgi:hypothetical protein
VVNTPCRFDAGLAAGTDCGLILERLSSREVAAIPVGAVDVTGTRTP